MPVATSSDGTAIAYAVAGSGPPLVLVGGGLDDGAENEPLFELLATSFTVLNYARRGRGASGDTLPYAVEREFEDLAALIELAGGSAHVYGVSSGGALALRAAEAGVPISRLGVYEVPHGLGPGWADYVSSLHELLAADRRGDALERFMRMAGSPDESIAAARASPVWPGLERLAPTLAYDAACLGDGETIPSVSQPVLVATGGANPFFEAAADALAAGLPHAARAVLGGQSHVADPAVVAPALVRFLR